MLRDCNVIELQPGDYFLSWVTALDGRRITEHALVVCIEREPETPDNITTVTTFNNRHGIRQTSFGQGIVCRVFTDARDT